MRIQFDLIHHLLLLGHKFPLPERWRLPRNEDTSFFTSAYQVLGGFLGHLSVYQIVCLYPISDPGTMHLIALARGVIPTMAIADSGSLSVETYYDVSVGYIARTGPSMQAG